MIRVRLIVTGDVEEEALGTSLERLFPGARFLIARKQGFTSSHPLTKPQLGGSKAIDIVTEMIAAGDAGSRPGEPPCDYAVGIDDLELYNAHQPHMVLEHVKHAVTLRLAELQRSDETCTRVLPKGKSKGFRRLETDADRRRYLHERCSFHLLSPMVEALFFGEVTVHGPDSPSYMIAERWWDRAASGTARGSCEGVSREVAGMGPPADARRPRNLDSTG